MLLFRVRTFLTCLTDNSIIEIGTNVNEYLKNNITSIERYEKLLKMKNIPMKTELKNFKVLQTRKYFKQKLIALRERQKNKIEDMHWKTINYITKNYKNIVIGNWSTKQCISNNTSILRPLQKKELSALRFYQFLQRLEFKSTIRNNNLMKVEEHYTSKLCSNCAFKNDIGGLKIYNCKNCKCQYDRDINSSKNILCKVLEI